MCRVSEKWTIIKTIFKGGNHKMVTQNYKPVTLETALGKILVHGKIFELLHTGEQYY